MAGEFALVKHKDLADDCIRKPAKVPYLCARILKFELRMLLRNSDSIFQMPLPGSHTPIQPPLVEIFLTVQGI